METPDSRLVIPPWVLCLCIVVSLVGIVDRDLWTPDEPRDASISLEMSRNHNYLVPHLAGKPFVEKPPLYFAVASGFVSILAPVLGNTAAIRLSTALWGIGTLCMTFLIARLFMERSRAVLASAVLATMVGFMENMHWIRVDAALAFFVAATTWSFAEVYIAGRPSFCLPGGLFLAGAFLSKGVIGPLLAGIAWSGMAIPWLINRIRKRERLFVAPHFIALVLFAIPVGLWMYGLRTVGGPKLWHEWFYENHFGRLAGTATVLGHMRPGEPLYYIKMAAVYCLPWIPSLLMWFVSTGRELYKTRSLSPKLIFLAVWIVGSIVLLTSSVTKRDIYLTPIMPAFAIICADMLAGQQPRWSRMFFGGWIAVCTVALALISTSPLWARALPSNGTPEAAAFLGTFTLRTLTAGVALVIALVAVFRRSAGLHPAIQLITVTAMLYVASFAVVAKAIDLEKELGNGTRDFVSGIPTERRTRIAGWNFCETTRAMFYYYCDWTVPLIDDKDHLERIIAGRDREYDSVIITRERSIPDLLKNFPYRVITEKYAGASKHRRDLYWVEGTRKDTAPEQ
jgi:4-amino-4-deoxy-L-arabinose transferase-like glycosyltransferase